MTNLHRYEELLSNKKHYLYRLEHNTFVVKSINLLYMDTPKTAGTSLKTRLAETEANYTPPEDSASLETVSEMFIHDRAINPLKPVTAYPRDQQQEMLFSEQWKRVCVVRNPYERLFSAWFSKILLRQPGFMARVSGYHLPRSIGSRKDIYRYFEEFVNHLNTFGCDSDPHWDLQTRLLFHDTIEWSKILRFETLQEELLGNKEYFGGNEIVLDRLNVSGFSPDWDLVSSETKKMIQSIYRDDFSEYNYSLDPPGVPTDFDTLVTYVNSVASRNDRLGVLFELNRQAEQEIGLQRREQEALRVENEALRFANQAAIDRLTVAESELDSLVSSRSWRVTRPLRAMMDFLRSIRH